MKTAAADSLRRLYQIIEAKSEDNNSFHRGYLAGIKASIEMVAEDEE